MKLLVIAPAYWSTAEIVERKCWLYLASCAKAGIPDHRFYGVGATQYPGGGAMRLGGLVDYLQKNVDALEADGYTHVLSTDAWDIMFVRPFEELIASYQAIGAPAFLMGASSARYGFLDLHPPESDKYIPLFRADVDYRYPSSTFYMGEIRALIEQLGSIPNRHEHNESRAILNAFLENWQFNPKLDEKCQMFQEKYFECQMKDGRMCNSATDSFPCVVHFSNGSANQLYGKDDVMIPWALNLGIIAPAEIGKSLYSGPLDYTEVNR